MMKQFDHMIEPELNLELSNVFPRLKFLAGCGQFSDFSNNLNRIHDGVGKTLRTANQSRVTVNSHALPSSLDPGFNES
jgi:hypothetical protein